MLSKTLLSTFLLSSALFSSTNITVYNGFAYVKTSENQIVDKNLSGFKTKLPNNIISESLVVNTKNDNINIIQKTIDIPQSKINEILNMNLNKEVYVKKSNGPVKLISINPILVKSKNGITSANFEDLIFKNFKKFNGIDLHVVTKSKEKVNTNIDIKYITNGISWTSSYNLILKDNNALLKGDISVKNNSGKSYENCNIDFIAGDIHREVKHRPIMLSKSMDFITVNGVLQKNVSNTYKKYLFPFKISLKNNSVTSLPFLKMNSHYDKYIDIFIPTHFISGDLKNNVYVKFKTSKDLPTGLVRIFNNDDFLGAQTIENTPSGENVKILLGSDFDISAKAELIHHESDRIHESSITLIKIKNKSNVKKIIKLNFPVNRSRVKIKYEFPSHINKLKHNDTLLTIYLDPGEVFSFKKFRELQR